MELWDLYDSNRYKIGKTHVRGDKLPENHYHLVVHVWIQNDEGELLLSRRHPTKHFGNLYECTGGSVLAGETSLEGALRETKEELGLKLDAVKGKLLHSEMKQTHHSDNWLFHSNVGIENLTYQDEEVTDAIWVSKDKYEEMLHNGLIVPSLPHFYNFLLNL